MLIPEFEVDHETVSRDEWLRVWGVRATDALDHEDYTPSYGAAVALDQPNQVLIFERYAGGEDALRRHMARQAHDALMNEMTARQMTKRRVAMAWLAEVSDWGCWTPRDPSLPSSGHELSVLGFAFPDDAARHAFIESSRARAAEVLEANEAVVIGAMTVTQVDRRRPEMRVGDVFVVAMAANSGALEASTWAGPHAGRVVVNRAFRTADVGYFWK